MAGSYAGKNLGDKAAKVEKQHREAFEKGALGKEEYVRQQIMKEAWKNDDIYKQYGGHFHREEFNNDAREFIDNGVADSNEIVAAMKMRESYNKEMKMKRAEIENDNTLTRQQKDDQLSTKQNISNSDAVTVAQLNKKISNRAYGDPTKRARFEEDIRTSLRNQGFTGDVNKEAARQIRLVGEMKANLENL